MKKQFIYYLLIMASTLLASPLPAQIIRTTGKETVKPLSGTVYKVTPQRMEKYRSNALTILQNFYSTLPECGDLDVKENFIANVMETGTVLKVDFYTQKNDKKEFLSADRYILEFMKEYGRYIESGDGLEMELSDVSYDENLVHPDGDEHAVLLQVSYQLTIRNNGKMLKSGKSSAVCYYPSRTDYRTCKVRQIVPSSEIPVTIKRKRTPITVKTTGKDITPPVTEKKEPAPEPESVHLSSISTGEKNLNCTWHHPFLKVTLTHYSAFTNETTQNFQIDFKLKNLSPSRRYINMYKPFKLKVQDSEGKNYKASLYINNNPAGDNLVLGSGEQANCRILIDKIPMNEIQDIFIEWPVHCDELGININTANPIIFHYSTY